MPRPTSATTVQRPDLGAIAYEYMIDAANRGFIGLEILPIFDVTEQSADYPVIPIESLLKIPDTKRAPRGSYNRSDYEFETGTYACEEYGWEELIDDVESKLYARLFDAEEVAVKRAVDILLRGQEVRIASAVFNTSNITNTAAVTTEWSTITATPRADVSAAKTALRAATGVTPDSMAISLKVFENLMLVTEIISALRYTNPLEFGSMDAQKRLLAQYFGVKNLFVGGSIKDAAKKGQSFSISDIWDDEYCGLFKLSSGGKDLREPSLGRSFLWTSDSPTNLVTETYREEPKRSDVVRVRHHIDEAFIFTGAGYLLSNITA